MMTKEQRRERHIVTCKHFNGLQNTCCKAGVNYETVKTPKKAGGLNLPCIPYTPFVEEGVEPSLLCQKYERHTIEEIEDEERMWKESAERTGKAIKAIIDHAGKYVKGQGKQGVIECPTCKGKLHYSRAGYNGHIHASCETVGCVRFMQ